MRRKRRFHYPSKPFREQVHTVICAECGAERKATHKPESVHAPKTCVDCNRRKQQDLLHRLFDWPKASRPSA